MSVIDGVFKWLCGYLDNLSVNYLGANNADVGIEAEPGNFVVRKYIDGGELRALPFTIALRGAFTSDAKKSLEVPGFFENLEKWIEQKNEKGELPEAEGIKAVSIECTSHGYGVSNTNTLARYQMNCRFLYTVK